MLQMSWLYCEVRWPSDARQSPRPRRIDENNALRPASTRSSKTRYWGLLLRDLLRRAACTVDSAIARVFDRSRLGRGDDDDVDIRRARDRRQPPVVRCGHATRARIVGDSDLIERRREFLAPRRQQLGHRNAIEAVGQEARRRQGRGLAVGRGEERCTPRCRCRLTTRAPNCVGDQSARLCAAPRDVSRPRASCSRSAVVSRASGCNSR